MGPPAEARERLPSRLPRARVRGAHPGRRRGAHGRGAARSSRRSPTATPPSRCASTSSRPLDEPGLLVLLEVDTVRPLEIVVELPHALQYAWPGGLGGQYAFWNAADEAFVLSESLRRHNAFIGSPWATAASSHPAHALPDAPSTFVIPVDPARAARELMPIAIAAGIGPRAEVAAAYRGLLAGAAAALRGAPRATPSGCATRRCAIDTPDDRLDLALRVGEGQPRRAAVCNPGPRLRPRGRLGTVGRERAAGLRLVLRRRRGHQLARHVVAGQWRPAAEGLRFLAKYQRADGKIPHEMSQAAGGCPGSPSTRTPTTTPTPRRSGSLALWRAVAGDGRPARSSTSCGRRCRRPGPGACTTETDGDGIIENTTGGLGAIEVGAIGEDIHQDIYLAAVWSAAAGAMAEMAAAPGRARPRGAGGRARAEGAALARRRYWIERRRAPRLRGPALRRHERHAHRVAGDGGGLRSARARPRAPTLSALCRSRADGRLGRADADDDEPALRAAALQHGRGVAVRDRVRRRSGHYQLRRGRGPAIRSWTR